MKLFEVYLKKDELDNLQDVVMLRDRPINFGALVFGSLWFFVHKMWLIGFIVLTLLVGFSLIFDVIKFLQPYKVAFGLTLSFVIALNADYLHGYFLRKKKYVFAGCVVADNKSDAFVRVANLD